MKALLVLLFACGVIPAQNGEDLFAKTCASTYCHGTRGSGGGAPRLSARGLDVAFINNAVSRGVPGTSMPGFTATLSRAEMGAVVAYVAGLNGIVAPAGSRAGVAASPPRLSEEASNGRELFSEAVRGFGRCSTCHETGGIGIPVAAPIAKVPADVKGLRDLATPAVRTATLDGVSLPALAVSNGSRATIFYDLTSAPPVLHNAQPGSVTWKDVSAWRHSSVTGSYTETELAAVLAYLRGVSKRSQQVKLYALTGLAPAARRRANALVRS